MVDPVDTNAPSVAAVERDLLTKDVEFWIEQSETWKRLANDERDVTNRLRTVIENAPHEEDCCIEDVTLVPGWEGAPTALRGHCTCWKADALG